MLQVQQELVVALARCLACVPSQPPAQPNRQQYVTHLLEGLPASLQQLASLQAPASAQQTSSANATADRLLQNLQALMMFMQSWRDAQNNGQQPGQAANAAVAALVSCWPICEQVLASQLATVGLRERLAACWTTALRMHVKDCLAVVGSVCNAAARAVASMSADAHAWCQPLSAALDQLAAQQANVRQQMQQVTSALRVVESSPACDLLMDRALADQNPELATVSWQSFAAACPAQSLSSLSVSQNAVSRHFILGMQHGQPGCALQAVLHLIIAVARASPALRSGNHLQHLRPLLDKGLAGAAACAACNHKDVSNNGLACLAILIGMVCLQQYVCCMFWGLTGLLLAPAMILRVRKFAFASWYTTGVQ